MKHLSWQVVVFTFLGIGLGLLLSILAAYTVAYLFGGIEEGTFILFSIVLLLIFTPLGIIAGKIAEKKMR